MSGVNGVMWCWVSGEWDAEVLGQWCEWCDTVVLGE